MFHKPLDRQYSHDAKSVFEDYIQSEWFPCVGAKSALATKGLEIAVGCDLRSGHADDVILGDLQQFAASIDDAKQLVSLAVIFPATPRLSETAFETALWDRLQALHQRDAQRFAWDDAVSGDPKAPNFGISLGGKGFYVVGLHPGSSRKARQAPFATLVFNAHSQFQKLREDGRYDRLRAVVRERDTALQGGINPMLADHGAVSEAPQYSGRRVGADWVCPFHKVDGNKAS